MGEAQVLRGVVARGHHELDHELDAVLVDDPVPVPVVPPSLFKDGPCLVRIVRIRLHVVVVRRRAVREWARHLTREVAVVVDEVLGRVEGVRERLAHALVGEGAFLDPHRLALGHRNQIHLRHIPGRQMASEGEDMVPLPLEGRDARY